MNGVGGEFHIKAGGLLGEPPYSGLKVNGGCFGNRVKYGLPDIQGLIFLSRADNGVPLAVMDSIEITIQRTAAATALAGKFLARAGSRTCTICGCGTQGRAQFRALVHVEPIERVFARSRTAASAEAFAIAMSRELGIQVTATADLGGALRQSNICITCTPGKSPFLRRG